MKPAAAAAHAVTTENADVRPAIDTRANRYDIVSRLADDLAHEIKNPLNAIVVNLEVLRRKIQNGAAEVAVERAYVVDEEVTRVHTMVDQLLQLMRPAGAEVKIISLDETVAELDSILMAQAKAARINLELNNDSGSFVNASREAVKFAVLNVIVGIYEQGAPNQIAVETRASGDHAEVIIKSTPVLMDGAGEFVRHARTWIEMAGGTLEIGELAAGNVGTMTTLRMPACSSFA